MASHQMHMDFRKIIKYFLCAILVGSAISVVAQSISIFIFDNWERKFSPIGTLQLGVGIHLAGIVMTTILSILFFKFMKQDVLSWKAGCVFGFISTVIFLIYGSIPYTNNLPLLVTLFCWIVLPVLISYPIIKNYLSR